MLNGMREKRRGVSGEEVRGTSAAEMLKFTGRGPEDDCVCEGLGWVYHSETISTIGGKTFLNPANKVRCTNPKCKYIKPKLNPMFEK
jgi:hypothetical protein